MVLNNSYKKKVSVYTKSGERAATAYYRIYQYLRDIGTYDINYRKMISDKLYLKIMPISSKGIILKGTIYIYIYFRVLFQLIKDFFINPDTLIISRRFINFVLPPSFRILLKLLKSRGVKIIWDFDDQIIISREISKNGFDFMSAISDFIIVASKNNFKMVKEKYKYKVKILPTTDGDMYKRLNNDIISNRLALLDTEIRIIWVGTSVSLPFVKKVCPALDLFAKKIWNSKQKKVKLIVVCDRPLNIKTNNYLYIENIEWTRETAIMKMLNSHIGIMPLEDTEATRGKGGFKLIQYLSVGLPIAGSPVGINEEILSTEVGVFIDTIDSTKWIEKLIDIFEDKQKWLIYSDHAYKRWCMIYNYKDNLQYWQTII